MAKKHSPHDLTTHHNFSQSCGGSNADENCSPVPRGRHQHLHAWAENIPPGELMRKMATLSLVSEQSALPHEVLARIFQITTTFRPSLIYRGGIIRTVLDGISSARQADYLDNYLTRILEEIALVRSMARFVTNGHEISQVTQDMALQPLTFFRADSMRACLRSYLTEKHDDCLSWAQCLQEVTHAHLLDVLNSRAKGKQPARYQSVLRQQEAHLVRREQMLRSFLPPLDCGPVNQTARQMKRERKKIRRSQ